MTMPLKGAALAASITAAEKALPAALADVASAQRRLDHALAMGADTTTARAALSAAIQRRQDAHRTLSDAHQQAEQRQHEKVVAVAAGLIASAQTQIAQIINRYNEEGLSA